MDFISLMNRLSDDRQLRTCTFSVKLFLSISETILTEFSYWLFSLFSDWQVSRKLLSEYNQLRRASNERFENDPLNIKAVVYLSAIFAPYILIL
ncbi:hypothetical protein T02_7389 [Trichinella nativa]|uniref:Uncharacterized protein n=1 Tax=Trichinella nativa TaxID=6335 RepID=A0A0V1L0R2_9BILA|nr:hypothetical protein T02_7389 [Trichinella nativa]